MDTEEPKHNATTRHELREPAAALPTIPATKRLVPPSKFLLRLSLGLLVLTAVAGIVAILISGLEGVGWKIFETATEVVAAAFLSLCFTGKATSRWFARLQVFGFLSALVALSYGIFLVWDDGSLGTGWPYEVFAVAAILAIGSAQACVLIPMRNPGRRIKWLALGTAAAILVFSGMAVGMSLSSEFAASDWYLKITAIFLVLDILGTVLLPVLRHFGTHVAKPRPHTTR